jgi:hypothetical protein
MEFYYSAPLWDKAKCPNLCKTAKPTKWQTVANTTVVHVKNGTYRNAVFSGTFALDESHPLTTDKSGWTAGIFYCLWFEHRLQTRGVAIKFDPTTSEVVKGFSGDIVTNLSK